MCVAEYAVLDQLINNIRSDRVRKEFLKTPEDNITNTKELRIWV